MKGGHLLELRPYRVKLLLHLHFGNCRDLHVSYVLKVLLMGKVVSRKTPVLPFSALLSVEWSLTGG